MFAINRRDIESKAKQLNSKSNPGKNNNSVYSLLKQSIWNVIDTVQEFSVYEMSYWISNMDRWIHNRTCVENKTSYKRGTILFVDLGANNFRFEPSFTHPCVVLINRKNSMLVAPCSTKKYGQGHRDIIDAQKIVDGFAQDTGIQIENIRWVHKNRVVDTLGEVSTNVLNKIDAYLLNSIPTYKKERVKFLNADSENTILKSENENLKNENEELKEKIKKLNESICELEKKIG